MTEESEITRILNQIDNGSTQMVDRLIPVVYGELRKMAAVQLRSERAGISLAATGLVHEAYIRLVDNKSFDSRRHFFGAAAVAMRRILIERARVRNASKRGGGAAKIDCDPDQFFDWDESDERLGQLDEALSRFAVIEPQKAELVKLRFFVGLTIREAAQILGMATATADRHWAYAKAWLQSEIRFD